MSKFKHAALALAAAGLLSAQAHAGEAQVQDLQAVPVAAFSQSDIQSMFEQAGQPMEMAALSTAEMKETEGAVWWFAAYYYGPAIAGAGSWLATSGWRAIPGFYHNVRQRW
ncbi:MAG: hypothetical protein C0443_11560 [Comamonadaceae bacterium]|nr:hypothetical protein [Comamonadaceae bacterium]